MELALKIVFIIISVVMSVIILMQEGKQNGLSGSLGGGQSADTYWSKNKGRSMEGKLERFTLIGAIIFFVGAILLNMNF